MYYYSILKRSYILWTDKNNAVFCDFTSVDSFSNVQKAEMQGTVHWKGHEDISTMMWEGFFYNSVGPIHKYSPNLNLET